MLSASDLPSSPFLLCETSLPAVVKIASTAALVSSKLVNVVSRAPAIQKPPILHPILTDNEDTPVKVLIKAAIGVGSSVPPDEVSVAGGSRLLYFSSALLFSSGSSDMSIVAKRR